MLQLALYAAFFGLGLIAGTAIVLPRWIAWRNIARQWRKVAEQAVDDLPAREANGRFAKRAA